jgi:hypothetical protein
MLAGLAGLGCTIFILIEAFRDALWKGLLSLLCGFYLLYYAFFDFEHDDKWLIVLGSMGGGAVMTGLLRLAQG